MHSMCLAAMPWSRNNFQRHDFVAFKFEEEPKIDRAARKVPGKPARDDAFAVFLLTRYWLARVLIFGRGFLLPPLDRGTTIVRVPLILHDSVIREAPR